MGFIVKNTTKCGLLDVLCPYRCRGCGELGTILCDCCKKDITNEVLNHCPKCGRLIGNRCDECRSLFKATFAMGYRDELVGKLAEEYKFFGVKRLGGCLAEILDEFLPDLGGEVVVIPLPTIRAHIRARGVDHTFEIAKKLAKRRGWKVKKMLVRKKNTVQVGANDLERRKQAKEAYRFCGEIQEGVTYVLFDDIWTTGSSMTEAGRILKKNGAKKMVAVVLATNRSEKRLKSIRSERR